MTLSGIDTTTSNPNEGQISTRVLGPTVLPPAIDRILERIPAVYRNDDDRIGQPLRRWLRLIADQITPIDDIANRGEANADPDVVPADWLPWLGQLIGVPVDTSEPVQLQRTRLRDPERHRHGSAHAIAARVRPLLTGAQAVDVVPHWRGNPWVVCIRTAYADTPLTGETLRSWAELSAVLPTWADLDEVAYGAEIDRIRYLIVAAALPECPAGARLAHQYLP